MADKLRIKTVSTVVTTNSAGGVVESRPVREVAGPVQNTAGTWIDPILVEETADGVPVRFVTDAVVVNSAGVPVAATPVKGGGYVLPTPIMLESFDDTAGFTLSTAVVANDAVNKVQGTNSQRMNNTTSNTAIATKTAAAQYDPSTFGVIASCVDVDPVNIASMEVDLGRSGTFTGGSSQSGIQEDVLPQPRGKTWFARNVSEFTSLPAGLGALQVRTRFSAFSGAGLQGRMNTDALLANAAGRPTVIISFDDGYGSQFNTAKAILDGHGFKGTYHPAPANIDTGSYMTTANLQQLNAEGHDIACDNMTDSPYTNFATLADGVQSYVDNRNWLTARGMTRAIDFGCYPGGNFAATPVKAQVTAVVATGTTSVSWAMTPAITLAPGMKAYGRGLPLDGSTIVTVTDQQNVVLADAVPAATTTLFFLDLSGQYAGTKIPDALKAAGAKLMRINTYQLGFSMYTRFGFGDRGMWFVGNGYTGKTDAQGDALVDEAILRGTTLYTIWHGINTGGGFDSTVQYFTDRMAYIASKRDAGLLDVLTVSQLWARDSGGEARLQAIFP